MNPNTPVLPPLSPAYKQSFWTSLQQQYVKANYWYFCNMSLYFEELWDNDETFRTDCRQLANRFAATVGDGIINDNEPEDVLFSFLTYPSLADLYDYNVRDVRLAFLAWVIDYLSDANSFAGRSEI